jgi:neutral trehalase
MEWLMMYVIRIRQHTHPEMQSTSQSSVLEHRKVCEKYWLVYEKSQLVQERSQPRESVRQMHPVIQFKKQTHSQMQSTNKGGKVGYIIGFGMSYFYYNEYSIILDGIKVLFG